MKLSLRNKIFILVALPSIGLLILISMFILTNYGEYKDASESVHYAKYSNTISKFIHELQKERGKSALFLAGKISKEALLEQRTNSVKFSSEFNSSLPTTEIADKLKIFSTQGLKTLEEGRKMVDAHGEASEAIKLFSKTIQQLILSEILVAQTAKAFGNEKKLLSVALLDIAKENAGKLRANISGVLSNNLVLTTQQVNVISSLLAGLTENVNSPTLIISDKAKSALENFKETPEWKSSQETIWLVLNNADKGNYNQNPTAFFDKLTVAINNLGEIIFSEQEFVSNLILKKKQELSTKMLVIIFSSVVLLILVFVLGSTFIKSITGPIQGLMEKLNYSSSEVNEYSEKVSQSSSQLAQNSTEQASAIQQAVTSFEEITQMIAKTAENARTSQDVSSNSFDTATHGQSMVTELNTSIIEISDSNESIKKRILKSNEELEEISKIISEIGTKTRVINDIVFQTKLLSFNASVEAARAGEQGKGFAVVAEEIGNLAEMSGNAAKEISAVLDRSLSLVDKTIENSKKEIMSIIDESKQKVESGSRAAVKCSDSLGEIVERVQEVNKLVVEIAIAS